MLAKMISSQPWKTFLELLEMPERKVMTLYKPLFLRPSDHSHSLQLITQASIKSAGLMCIIYLIKKIVSFAFKEPLGMSIIKHRLKCLKD